MDFDVYSNVDEITIHAEYNKLKKSNAALQDHIKKLENDVTKLCNEMSKMKSIQDNLSINISELFKTAKMEIDRKDKNIASLRRQLDDLLFKRNNNKNSIPPKPETSTKLEEGELEEHSDSKSTSTREMDSDDNKEAKDRRDRQPGNRYYKSRNDDRRERYSKPNLNDRRRYKSPTERNRGRDSRRETRDTMDRNKRWRSPSPERHRRSSPKRYRKNSKSPPKKESDFRDIQKHIVPDHCKEANSKSRSKNTKIEENRVSNDNQSDGGKQNHTVCTNIASNLERANSNSELEIQDIVLEKVDTVECKIKQKMSLNDYRNKFQNEKNVAEKNSNDFLSNDENAVTTERQLITVVTVKPNEHKSEGVNVASKDIIKEPNHGVENKKNSVAEKELIDQKAPDNSKDSEALSDVKTDQNVLPELQDSATSTSSSLNDSTSQNKLNVVKVPKKKKRWTMLV